MAERRGSIRSRITLVASLIVVAVLVLGAFAFVGLLRSTLIEGVRGSAEADAETIISSLESGQTPTFDDDDRLLQVQSESGQVLASSENLEGIALEGASDSLVIDSEDSPFLVVVDDGDEGELVFVGYSLEVVEEAAAAATGLLWIAVPLLGALVAGLSWIVVGRALRPVERLRKEVDSITASRLGHRVRVDRDDEIGRLARTMNGMLDRLDRSQQAQQQFVSDASHELKSPLASLRQYAEVAARYPDRLSSAELADAVLDEGARLERLVQNMLLLARIDEQALAHSAVDLDDIVLAEAARLRSSTSVAVDISAVTASRVSGDESALGQVVRNLADNAARHAVSRVAFTLAGATLTVDDDGPGIPESERSRVWERFVRLDDARARDTGGSGLGLAIVREIVLAHGGTVAIDSSPLGGARFVVTLPRSS